MGDHSPSPSQDFHSILGVAKNASIKDICKSYKNLITRWHPDKQHSSTNNKSDVQAKFESINEAYAVLRNQKGSPGEGNVSGGNYSSDEDSSIRKGSQYKHRSIDSFYSPSITPPSSLSRSASRRSFSPAPAPSMLPKSTSRRSTTPIMFSYSTAPKKPPPIEKRLECTLEELCYGCVKKIKISRDVFTDTGTMVQEEELLRIKVKPGWRKGTKITFDGVGDEKPGALPADVIFLIEEIKHPVFQRKGDDLELLVEIPLVQALAGCNVTIPLLSGEKMNLQLNDIIHPGYEKIIAGQGMPVAKEQGRRGDLRIKFRVNFPTELSDEQRTEIVSLLDESP